MKRERQVPTLWEDLVDCSTTDEAVIGDFANSYREYAQLKYAGTIHSKS
jgi:hypothetical protein